LEQKLLVGIDVTMGLLRGERDLVEARKDELQFAGIRVDVADSKYARMARFEFLGVDGNEVY
jgi:hypothetical protein